MVDSTDLGIFRPLGGDAAATGPLAGGEDSGHGSVLPSLRQPRSGISTLQQERSWRLPDILTNGARPKARLIAARWNGTDLREQTSEIIGDYHMLAVTLKATRFSLWLGATPFPNREVIPGTIQLTRPALPARIVYHSAYDVLHLYIQNALLKECFEWAHGKPPIGDVVVHDPAFAHDPTIERLAVALLSAGDRGEPFTELYADALSLTIVARLLKLYAERPAPTSRRSVGALPKWRLRRVIDFMEAHAGRSVTLADLAQVAGLSRMHFAAQFREATGLRPHEYLVRRRVDKAKTMLATSALPIVDVALTAGFSSQSHFTGVFKRLTGLTPHRWRQRNRP